MKITDLNMEWLESFFPNLVYKLEEQKIVGELNFCACYDEKTKKLKIERFGRDKDIRNSDNFLCDVFEIEIRLDSASVCFNGWPKVYEVGGRYKYIAENCNVKIVDLHIYPDGACCLGIKYSPRKSLTIERFLFHLIVPFFYRLSYTESFGIEAARSNLWGEYLHGDEGFIEYIQEMRSFALHKPGRNDPCPCKSGVKYKKCCSDEVQSLKNDSIIKE